MRLTLKYLIFSVFSALTSLPILAVADNDVEIIISNASYMEFRDPGWLKIKTTNAYYEAAFFYDFISYDDISEWKEGESIHIIFKPSFGFGIQRVSDNKLYKLLFSTNNHPYQLKYDQCQKNGYSANCYTQFRTRIESDYNYFYDYILSYASPNLKPEVIKLNSYLQLLPNKYLSAFGIYADETGGTIHSLTAASSRLSMEKLKFDLITDFLY